MKSQDNRHRRISRAIDLAKLQSSSVTEFVTPSSLETSASREGIRNPSDRLVFNSSRSEDYAPRQLGASLNNPNNDILLQQLTSAAFNDTNWLTKDTEHKDFSVQQKKPYQTMSFAANNSHNSAPVPSGPFTLQLGPNITSYPFVNKAFSIPLFLYDGNRELVQGYEVPIHAELFYQQADSALTAVDDLCVCIH